MRYLKENKEENTEKVKQEEKEKKAKIKEEKKAEKAKLKKEKKEKKAKVKEEKKEKRAKNGTGRWIRKTSLTVLLILIIIVVCIGINLLVENANLSDLDVTSDKVYSLSDTSKDIISGIDKEVYIMVINMSESEEEFIQKYSSINDNIEIEIIDDLESRTDLTSEYGITADTSAVIVQSGDNEKILSASDFYTYDYTTYETIDTTEEAVTNAIVSVTTDETPIIYLLTGHNKYSSDYIYFFIQDLESEAYEVDELDLLTTGGVPDDCSVLMITTLAEDITELESEYILDYINEGGKIIFFTDPNASGTDMTNFQAVLDEFGVSVSEGAMLEQDTSKMLYQTPSAILVTVNEYTSVTKATDMNMSACFITSGKIEIADDDELEELGVVSETLATTSESSFYRTDYSISSSSLTDDDEELGNAVVGALLQKTIDDDTTSELIVYANNIFITNMTIASSSGYSYVLDYYNNEDLAMNSIAYLSDRENMITIRKDVEVTSYTVTTQQNTIILAIIFTIPAVAVIIGIVVWVYRRRKK